jgi:hypothetical protein
MYFATGASRDGKIVKDIMNWIVNILKAKENNGK